MTLRFRLWLILGVLSAAVPARAQEAYVQHPNVFVVNYDPVLPSKGGLRLHEVFRWNDPNVLNAAYRDDMAAASHGLVRYRIVQTVDADVFPIKRDGFRYAHGDGSHPDDYLYAAGHNAWHQPDGVDYRAIVREFDLARKVEQGVVDEVWIQGAPYMGYYESQMIGQEAYWVNSPGIPNLPAVQKFVVMGFNYERGVAEMLHSYGHRAESIMNYVYGGDWDITKRRNDWELFTHNVAQSGDAAVGTVHYPPNAEHDYDYANPRLVESTAPDWLAHYPNLTGETAMVGRETWGGPDYHRNFMQWWYRHMPHVAGTNTRSGYSRLNNWWAYLQDFNRYAESGGRVPEAAYRAAPPGTAPRALTADDRDDWLPQVNAAGRVVWYGFDGHDYEIFSAEADGTDLVQITDNAIDDVEPRLNDAGQVVWQAFDGTDYEIFTARTDGSALVQVTDNDGMDWHPAINDRGRIVWDGFDGTDYEIFSAEADGTGLVQITDNASAPGRYPFEDSWPQINNHDRVVWMGFDGEHWDIYSADADGTGLVVVSHTGWDEQYPRINDQGTVVYFARHFIDDVQVHTASAYGDPESERLVSAAAREDYWPQITNDGRVVWMGSEGGDFDIYSAAADGSDRVRLSDNPNDDLHPQVSDDGYVVWQGHDGSDWEIFLWKEGTVYQLTDNEVDDRGAAAAGPYAVWHARSGDGQRSEVYAAVGLAATAVDQPGERPRKPGLLPNYPNPFREQTTIRYGLPESGPVSLAIYTLDGRQIRTLVDGTAGPGLHEARWDGRDDASRVVASGTYLCRLTTGTTTDERTLVYVR